MIDTSRRHPAETCDNGKRSNENVKLSLPKWVGRQSFRIAAYLDRRQAQRSVPVSKTCLASCPGPMSCDGYLAFHALFPWKDVDVGIASVAFRGRLGGIGSGRAVWF